MRLIFLVFLFLTTAFFGITFGLWMSKSYSDYLSSTYVSSYSGLLDIDMHNNSRSCFNVSYSLEKQRAIQLSEIVMKYSNRSFSTYVHDVYSSYFLRETGIYDKNSPRYIIESLRDGSRKSLMDKVDNDKCFDREFCKINSEKYSAKRP